MIGQCRVGVVGEEGVFNVEETTDQGLDNTRSISSVSYNTLVVSIFSHSLLFTLYSLLFTPQSSSSFIINSLLS